MCRNNRRDNRVPSTRDSLRSSRVLLERTEVVVRCTCIPTEPSRDVPASRARALTRHKSVNTGDYRRSIAHHRSRRRDRPRPRSFPRFTPDYAISRRVAPAASVRPCVSGRIKSPGGAHVTKVQTLPPRSLGTSDRQNIPFSPGSGTQTASRFSSTSCRGSSYFSCCWP